ncbi:hypothetical protein [Nocardia sp. IFM 10818]
MDLARAARERHDQGFTVLPRHPPAQVLAPATAERGEMFPSAADYHSGADPRRERFQRDEFDGIDRFPSPPPN